MWDNEDTELLLGYFKEYVEVGNTSYPSKNLYLIIIIIIILMLKLTSYYLFMTK